MNYEQNHPDEEKLIEKIVETKRVAKVVKGGRNFSFTAIVVVGDKQGNVGVGNGKANEIVDAIRKAKEKAVKNMNKLYMKYLASDARVREYYFELSGILNGFISDSLGIKGEMTDGELLNLIKNENNKFNKYSDEILSLFEKYDKIKYTGQNDSDGREFFEDLMRTRDLIEKIQI